jgi:hypothetical protein
MEIYEKLLNIQNELTVNKDLFNSFGKYNYRSCESILEKVKPLCLKYKVVLSITDEIKLIGDRYYVEAKANLFDIESCQATSAKAYAREAVEKKGMDESQITGSASSYARKYALSGMFALDDGKDADSDDNTEKPVKPVAQKPTPKAETPKPVEAPKAEVKEDPLTAEDIKEMTRLDIKPSKLATYFSTTTEKLTHAQAQQAIIAKKKQTEKQVKNDKV